MVEIKEENGQDANEETNNNQQQSNDSANQGHQSQGKSFMAFLKENPNEVLGFTLRMATIYFVLSYILPIAPPHIQKLAYTKAIAAAAATNAFRLHQRLRTVNLPILSQNFLVELMMQDSAHYLFYCLILVMSSPITLALLPITIYAIFNMIVFLNKFATEVGYVSMSFVSWLHQLKQQQTINMLSTVACAEIFLFPLLIAMVFNGKTSLFTPFVYYRFLTMRYLSRRNPYTREMFLQLKLLLFSVANHQSCPALIQSAIFKFVSLVQRIAPQM